MMAPERARRRRVHEVLEILAVALVYVLTARVGQLVSMLRREGGRPWQES